MKLVVPLMMPAIHWMLLAVSSSRSAVMMAGDGLGARSVEVGDHGDVDAAAGAAHDLFLVALQHVEDAAAHGADAQQADLDGFQLAHFE